MASGRADSNHRRCAAGCLVYGVYTLEGDFQLYTLDSEDLDSKWWTFFGLEMRRTLVDDVDGSIHGIVYKWPKNAARPPGAPRTVFAFRGTLFTRSTYARDLRLDVDLVLNALHTSSRYEAGVDAVRRAVRKHGGKNVWIAGHSLGAALAMLVGRKMVEEGFYPEAHLFSPPFISAPLERIKDSELKRGLYSACDCVSAALALALKDRRARMEARARFMALCRWVPHLYVNSDDTVCSAYIGYFYNLYSRQLAGEGEAATFAAQHSIGDTILWGLGMRNSRPFHLIPSANLNVNLKAVSEPHALDQWWAPDIDIHFTRYTRHLLSSSEDDSANTDNPG